jgi:hypothetical protein
MDNPSQGTPTDVEDHPAYNKPDATEHYAGTELPNPFMDMGPRVTPMPDNTMKPEWKKPTYTIEPRKGKGWK